MTKRRTRSLRPNEVAGAQSHETPVSSRRVATRGTPDREDVLSGTFLTAAGRNVSLLTKRLKLTWQTLQNASNRQEQQDEGLATSRDASRQWNPLLKELLQSKICRHTDPNVQSLVGCCLVEIMRVHAPDSPFQSSEELYLGFTLLCNQVRALTQDKEEDSRATTRDLHCLHILESLATVKSCLLVVGLDYTRQDEEPMMVQLFQTLFDTMSGGHSVKVENLMLSIMVACIEESDAIEQPLLDVILSPLVDAAPAEAEKTESAASPSHMARELIRRTSEHLQSPMSHFFNSILIDAPGSLRSSELKEYVYTLIYEVHKIDPSLLLYVLPNVCLQLQVDEVATRSEAIGLMGKLFASSHADYGHEFMKNFRDFLGRFRDASKEIRLQMVQISVQIWEHKTELASLLEKEFILRLSDPEWEVRQLVVHELCDLAANQLDLISEECLRAVGERMKDKKVILRKETMTGLSQVFSTHISSYWEENDDDKPLSLTHRSIPAAHVKKLGWIPDYVLKCYAYPQQELKLRVIQLLDDFLLPKAFSEQTRANGLLFIFHSLDATSKEALRRIFIERAKCQDVCQRFVSFKIKHRQKERDSVDAGGDTLEKAKKELQEGLTPHFSDVSKLGKLVEKLTKWKDHTVFKHIGVLCDVSKSQREARQARDQLVRIVGSKSPLGDFLKKLCRKLSLLTISQTYVAVYLDFLLAKEGRPSRQNRSVVDLLVMASDTLPELFAPYISDKVGELLIGSDNVPVGNQSAMSNEEDEEGPLPKDPKVLLGVLHILANYSHHWLAKINCGAFGGDESNAPSAALAKQLHKYCLGESDDDGQNFNAAKENEAAELAALTIADFYGGDEETDALIDTLCSKKKIGSLKSLGALPTLQSLEVFTKRCSSTFTANQLLLYRLWTHLLDDLIPPGEQSHIPDQAKERKNVKPVVVKEASVRCLAIKVAVNLLVYCQSTGNSVSSQVDGAKLVKLLFDVLRSDGKTWTSNAVLAANFRAAASCGLMKIVRNRQLEASITVSQWHLLGFTMQDASEDVRRKFLKKLMSHMIKQPMLHPHKYLSYLALAGTESSTSLKKSVRSLLKIAIERMRRMFDAASSRQSELTCSPNQPSVSALMVPEYSLPYVIHLLAHHPEFPGMLVERTSSATILHSALWTDQLAFLGFFLDGLVSANARAADNISFLLQMLTKLSQCHDVTSPDSKNIYPLIDSVVVLLKKKIKNQSNLKPFPGKIFLPKHLYSPGRPTSSSTVMSHVRIEPEAPETLGSASTTYDTGSRLDSTLLSPIKPMDFAAHFMKLNSPPGSSLKRKRSLTSDGKQTPSAGLGAKRDNNDPNALIGHSNFTTPLRRQSLMRKGQPEGRTYADDSSDSSAESDTFLTRKSASFRSSKPQLKRPSPAASSLPAAGTGIIAEEDEVEEQTGVLSKKRKTIDGTPEVTAEGTPVQEKPRLRSSRRLRQQA